MYTKDDFLTDYSHFEQWCQEQGYADVKELENEYSFRSIIKNDLDFYRHIRNYLTHNPRTIERLSLTDAFKNDFNELCKGLMAELSDVAIPISKIFKREMSDKIGPTIKIMKERVFTHTPIMNGKKVWGVFSENTLFNIAENEDYSRFNGSTCFIDIASYITAHNHASVYDFIAPTISLEEVKRLFSEASENGRKLEVLFITSTGKKDGDLKGMITIWDITTL